MGITQDTIKGIVSHFQCEGTFTSFSELTSGHINDTFLVETDTTKYVVQRINSYVFPKSKELIENKVKVSNHITQKLSHLPEDKLKKSVLQFVPAKDGNYYHLDAEGNYWNVSLFIEGSKTFERVENEEIAFEAGKLVGEFIQLTDGIDITEIVDILPKFHEMSFRYQQFYEAEGQASVERLKLAAPYIEKVKELKEEMHVLEHLKNEGKIPLRVTHNDTKISNILFDANNKGMCVIDTDTVMVGIIHYDFGDAIRTTCNNAYEDETDLSKVTFSMPYFKAFSKGFIQKMHTQLTELDVAHLPLAAKTITFIMGLRMLTDFLNNDVYYKTKYENHNLDRAKNQFRLVDEITLHFSEMKEVVENVYKELKTEE